MRLVAPILGCLIVLKDIMPKDIGATTLSRNRVYKRALIVRFGGLGDILLSTPTIRTISEANPGIQIDYIVGKGLAPILEGLPYIGRIIEFDKHSTESTLRNVLSMLENVRGKGYDLFVNLQPSVKTILIGIASGASKQILFKKNRRKNSSTGRVRHAIADFGKELAALGLEQPRSSQMDFVVPLADRNSAAELTREAGLLPPDRLVVINPAASHAVNRWPPYLIAQLIDLLVERPGVKVAITGAASDRPIVDEIDALRAMQTPTIDLVGRLGIKQLGAIMERAAVVVSGDTGPMHIAAALGRPLVALFGPADPDRTGPLTSNSIVIADRSLPCVPCQQRKCRFGAVASCMNAITPTSVADAVSRYL